MTLPKTIRIALDYQCWPLWNHEELENIDPAMLPISDSLKADWNRYAEMFEESMDYSDPGNSTISIEQEQAIAKLGCEIYHRLVEELPQVIIVHHGKYFERYADPTL